MSSITRNPRLVTLNVYDLHGTGGAFADLVAGATGGGGAYHGGIEVYFLEWSYGRSFFSIMVRPGVNVIGVLAIGASRRESSLSENLLESFLREILGTRKDLRFFS